MKGKQGGQSEGGGMIVGAEVCAMHSENGRWPPAKECGQPPEAARGQGRGPPPKPAEGATSASTPPHQHAEGTSSTSTFRLGLPDFSLLISRTVEE